MALPNNEQYIRGMALESATAYAASRARSWEAYEVVELAEYFAEYIRDGNKDAQTTRES